MSDHAPQLIVRQPAAATSPALPVLTPRADVRVRPATLADVPFMDALQKQHARQLGYFPTKQFEGYVGMGAVLIAEGIAQRPDREGGVRDSDPDRKPLPHGRGSELGYLISRDRYLKRDELGVVYQLCVVPDVRRGLIGATLLKAAFDRSAYGCKLYCCWCAQDLAANYFWESMGFVPIAFRGGSGKKKRVHIFWQKRIRAGDTTTPWWFPAKTEGGAMRADRIVLPIPPGYHWGDEMPALRSDVAQAPLEFDGQPDAGAAPVPRRSRRARAAAPVGTAPHAPDPAPPAPARGLRQFGGPEAPSIPPAPVPPPAPVADVPAPLAKAPRERAKVDGRLVAVARELRDRWLEAVGDDPSILLPAAKYDLARALPAAPAGPSARLLPAA